MLNKYTVWRNYFNRKIPIYGGVKDIHNKILNASKKVSKYTKEDADLLTKFFQEYKKLQSKNPNTITEFMQLELLNTQVKVPFINFEQSGAKFESFLQNLLQKNFDLASAKVSDTLGGQSAAVYLNLGQMDNNENYNEFLQRVLGDSVQDIVNDTTFNIVKDIEGETETYYLKVGAKRSGKIDNKGDGEVNIDIIGNISPEMENIINILKNASFSVKSYSSNSDIHLGRTNKIRAVSAVANYVGSIWAKGSALYYINYSDIKQKDGEDIKELEEIYKHYEHMRKVYELTGIGLNYGDYKTLYSTDFLLVNRTKGDIKVFSTQDLIQKLEQTGKYSIKV